MRYLKASIIVDGHYEVLALQADIGANPMTLVRRMLGHAKRIHSQVVAIYDVGVLEYRLTLEHLQQC